jgi:hypothetical protein
MSNPNATNLLNHVFGSLRRGDNISLRNNLDPWFAHEVGGDFLTSGGRPHTYNYPCPHKHWMRLRHPHFWVTREAAAILELGRLGDDRVRKPPVADRNENSEAVRLMVDHAIPFAVLKPLLEHAARRPFARLRFRGFLLQHFGRGVLTKAQDERLNIDGLQDAMPRDWDGKDVFARYKAMGFQRFEYQR